MLKQLLTNLFVAMLIVGVAGCTEKGQTAAQSTSHSQRAAPKPVASADGKASGSASTTGGDHPELASRQRMIVRTANVVIETDDPGSIYAKATRIVDDLDGWVAHSDATAVSGPSSQVSMTVKVPADKFRQGLSQLAELGVLRRETIESRDVTDEFVDLGARLRAQRQLENRYLGLLQQAGSVKDTLEIEQELASVRTEIERLQSRQKSINQKVAMSTISLTALQPASNSGSADSNRWIDAFDDAGDIFVTVVGGLIRIGGGLIPIVVLVGLAATPVIIWWRRRRSSNGQS